MNGRMYDPVVGRMLSTDNNINGTYSVLGYDRYSYALNNPLKYTDPDGEFVITAAVLIGITIGAALGYSSGIDKGASGWKLAAYTLGGAAVGGLSAGVGGAITATGGVAANTLGIVGASTTYSMGQKVLTGGDADFSVSFGAGSYNFDTQEFGYLGKKGNSKMQNFGYGMGVFGNLSDAFALMKGAYGDDVEDVMVTTYNDPPVSHIAVVDLDGKTIISYGPRKILEPSNKEFIFGGTKGTNDSKNYFSEKSILVKSLRVRNVRVDKMQKFGLNHFPNSDYALLRTKGYSCVSAASGGLWAAGVFHIPYVNTPITLEMQLVLRNNAYLSYLVK